MQYSGRPTVIPMSVKLASALMFTYALLILAMTAELAIQPDAAQTRELLRGLVRAVGVSGLACWLLTLDKKAWKTSITVCGILAIIGVVGVVMLAATGVLAQMPLLDLVIRLLLPIYLLGQTAIILTRRDTRAAFATGGQAVARTYARTGRYGRRA